MGERWKKIKPFNHPSHGAGSRSGRPMPRASSWETAKAQSEADKTMLVKHIQLERIAERYPVFGNRNLSAYNKKPEILYTVERNKAFALEGDTGSGKSTQLGQFLYEAGYHVIHIVPRKVIADGLHARLIEEMSEHVDNADKLVGVVHGDRTDVHDDNQIVIMTANTYLLMEKDIREKYGDEKVAIVCDETHESNLYVDIALGAATQSVSEHENWRVAAVSATQNQKAIGRAFKKIVGKKVEKISIEGRPHSLEFHEAPDQFAHELYAEIGHNIDRTIIFTSGIREVEHIIKETTKILDERQPGSAAQVDFRKFYKDLSPTERAHVLNDPVPEGKRVVIVSTPALMSGVTAAGTKLVITDGTINVEKLDQDTAPGLRRRILPRDGVIQMGGRAGRDVEGGIAYLARPTMAPGSQMPTDRKGNIPLDLFVSLENRELFSSPEIYESLLGEVALTIAAGDRSFTAINDFLPNPVEPSGIISAHDSLYRMGAMLPSDETDDLYKIADIGRQMHRFPMRPELSRGLVEATGKGKSLKHMVRVAYIATALHVGGLQDFSEGPEGEWQQLLRPTTDNDWIAQLDLMQALPGIEDRFADEHFTAQYDLNFNRVEQAMKVVSRVFRELDIRNPEMIRDVQSNRAEEDAVVADMMAGMGDFVYQRAGVRNRRRMYRNIHGNKTSTQRYVSDRTVTSQIDHGLVAGWPRYFYKKGRFKNDIVELVAPTDRATVAHFARQHDTFERRPTGGVKVHDGKTVQEYIPSFGSLQIDQSEYGVPISITQESARSVIIEHALNNPGPAQKALREVARACERLQRAVPAEILNKYKNPDTGPLLTHQMINEQVAELAKTITEFYEIDRKLGDFLYHGSYHISTYFTQEAYEELQKLAPHEIRLADGAYAQVHYASPNTPYVTLSPGGRTRDKLRASKLSLPDGRAVFVKTQDSENRAVYITTDQL